MEGFTPDQRFFIGLAQWACENQRPENQRVNAITDPHSPGKYRINGVVVNMPEFQQAFSCKTGQPMGPENRCRVWQGKPGEDGGGEGRAGPALPAPALLLVSPSPR